jgi:signal transduction histidine kinase
MSGVSGEVIRHITAMAEADGRQEGARALAEEVGAEAVLVFIRDAELVDRLVPAPGFSATLPGGRSWRALLDACRVPGVHHGEVAYPTAASVLAACACVSADGSALIMLGGAFAREAVDACMLVLPALGAALRAEQRAVIAAGEAALARASARRAATVAQALDAARGDLAHALAESGRLNEGLRQEQAVRERLLGIVGHDLRTPLAAISMAATLLLRRGTLGPSDADAVHRIRRGAERMGQMIHHLLDFTQARLGGGLPMRLVSADLDALCQEVVGETMTSHPGATLRYSSDGATTVECDPVRWSEVVSNLVGNAIKYGLPTRPIDVSLRTENADVILTVHNEGTPIAPEFLPRVFDPMQRGGVDHAGTAGSLGLGLYIVSEILHAHGGTIDVRSTLEQGTTFTVRLPRLRKAEAEAAEAHS